MARILVIDDEPDICFILKTFLTRDGHTVDTAENGKLGIQLTEVNDYDLVVTDMIMPEMDGLEVIAALKARPQAPRIIALTGGSERLDRSLLLSTAKAMRADKVIAKPIDMKVLRAAVDEVLAG
ncbi:MAG TPA: response regulator [Desulfuromonadales bacterium]|nr:response regulator [Desulfuromonadales bacterium]